MRLMVTGGAGFIGSALVRYLVLNGHIVLNLDRLSYAGDPSSAVWQPDRYHFAKLDINDAVGVSNALEAFKPERIFHLAAESHVDRSISGAAAFVQSNVVGTYHLLEAVRQYWERLSPSEADRFRFLHVSTDEVYGSLGHDGAFGEEDPYRPNSPYSASKAASDHFVHAWHATYGLPVILSNCSNNYGPFQLPEKLIPLAITNALDGLPIPVYGTGNNVRDWLYVEDHVQALALIVEQGRVGQRYNIGGNSERRNIDVVRALLQAMERAGAGRDTEALITFIADRPGHDWRYAVDTRKLESELGWRPSVAFEDGLERTVAWYLANESWWRPAKARLMKSRDDR